VSVGFALRERSRGPLVYLAVLALLRLSLVLHHVLSEVVSPEQSGDIPFYYQMVQLSDRGLYSYVHFWSEYPPLFPLLVTGLYRGLATLGLNTQQDFTTALQLMLFGIEVANLVLLFHLINRVHGLRAARLATAIYAACPALVFFSSGWFDPLAVLFSLAALWSITNKRAATAGVLIGLGILTKIYPGVLILTLPAALGWPGTRRAVAWTLGTIASVIAPLMLIRADLLLASFASMVTRPPWETVAALLNGNYMWGSVPDPQQRLEAASAFVTSGTPIALTVVPAILLGLAVLGARFALKKERQVYAVAALAVTSFVLANKGFSPQFIAWIIPMILLVWPNRTGLAYVVLLSVHFLMYDRVVFPTMVGYFETGQVAFDAMAPLVWMSVLARTLILAAIALHLLVKLAVPSRARYPFSESPCPLLPSQIRKAESGKPRPRSISLPHSRRSASAF
jgi:Glycosyltransferase family 87